jgi:hypothetical protein
MTPSHAALRPASLPDFIWQEEALATDAKGHQVRCELEKMVCIELPIGGRALSWMTVWVVGLAFSLTCRLLSWLEDFQSQVENRMLKTAIKNRLWKSANSFVDGAAKARPSTGPLETFMHRMHQRGAGITGIIPTFFAKGFHPLLGLQGG